MRALVFILLALTLPPANAQTPSQLRYVCKDFVERQLHDPSSAKLEWTEGSTGRTRDGLYVVRFKGRARNAYGALQLATFECTMRYQAPDHFTAVRIRTF